MQARASALERLVEAGCLEIRGALPADEGEEALAALDIARAVEAQLERLKRQLEDARSTEVEGAT